MTCPIEPSSLWPRPKAKGSPRSGRRHASREECLPNSHNSPQVWTRAPRNRPGTDRGSRFSDAGGSRCVASFASSDTTTLFTTSPVQSRMGQDRHPESNRRGRRVHMSMWSRGLGPRRGPNTNMCRRVTTICAAHCHRSIVPAAVVRHAAHRSEPRRACNLACNQPHRRKGARPARRFRARTTSRSGSPTPRSSRASRRRRDSNPGPCTPPLRRQRRWRCQGARPRPQGPRAATRR